LKFPSWLLASIVLVVSLVPATAQTSVPLFYDLPPKGRQLASDEANTLNMIWNHVHNADQIANQILARINSSTTGFWGTIMQRVPGSAASDMDIDSRIFTSEASTALVECDLLDGGLEDHVSDEQYKEYQQNASHFFTLTNQVSLNQYRFDLQLMLKTLDKTATTESAAFKAEWGVSYVQVLQR
jgi:hypothetical protein